MWAQFELLLLFPPPPRGLIDSEICHIASSEIESSKLSKNIIIGSLSTTAYLLWGN